MEARTPYRSWLLFAVALAAYLSWTAVPADGAAVPDVLTFPSAVGQVSFPHAMHVEDVGMACTDCHHEVNAKPLSTPHRRYLDESRVNCRICHHEAGKPGTARKCGECHHRGGDIADETLSAKVVIHETCKRCHEIGTGEAASASCGFCHSGPRRPW